MGELRLERAKARKAAQVAEAVKAVALCHNVTPIDEDDDNDSEKKIRTYQVRHARCFCYVCLSLSSWCLRMRIRTFGGNLFFQAASPVEIALVQWTEEVGLSLTSRQYPEGQPLAQEYQ
jgi:magnesium-transporting ATPase (P-type)